ncbi:Ger(x)C family spore germination protein [Syntrophomonas zehnderi]|nr:Ger(x)C family spore germination protein [Syntrophomonas zehnderi]
MRHIGLCGLILAALLIGGCGKIELQDTGIPLSVGADLKDDQIDLAICLANPLPTEKSTDNEPQFMVLNSSGSTFSEAIRNISLSFSDYPLWSHLQLSIVGENLARSDMSLVLDFITRNRYVRKDLLIVVTHKVTPAEILSVKPILAPHPPTAIKKMLKIQEAETGIYTPMNYTEILHRFLTAGIEPIIPMITIDRSGAEDRFLLDGMAVFKGRKMVGILNENESRGFRLMRPEQIRGGLFIMPSPLNRKNLVTLELSRSQAKITPVFKDNQMIMKIQLKAEGNFYEQSGTDNLFTEPMFKRLEAAAEQELTQQILDSIHKAQELNSDIFGWGEMVYRSDPRIWKTLEPKWDQIFPAVQSDISVDFSLRRSYLTDKSFVFR